MRDNENQVVVSNNVSSLVSEGAALLYEPVDIDGRMEWVVFIQKPGGTRQQVYIGRTGEAKRFKSADALVKFHCGHYPDATELVIPVFASGTPS